MGISDLVANDVLSPEQALAEVTSRTGKGVYASADVLFSGQVFGRDSLVVAEDLMEVKPELVEQILLILAGFQGVKTEMFSEEEPGKIMHQYATNLIDGVPRDGAAKLLYEEIAKKWGGDTKELVYYGSIDATPLFVRVLCRYCDLNGRKILQRKILRSDGTVLTMRQIMDRAVSWIFRKLQRSPVGLLGYRKLNPHGLQNQVWKDSTEFYIHPDGRWVNHSSEVISVEVQGLVYDSLRSAAKLLPRRAVELIGLADKVQRQVFEMLWMPEEDYFGLGLDYDEHGKPRLIRTITANAGNLLDSTIFDNLPDVERTRYLTGILRRLFSQDFLTNAGIRSRALRHHDLVPFWDYHGSFVTWPKETFAIARGLHRHSFNDLAKELENRIINVANRGGGYFEFIYVDGEGRVLLGPESTGESDDTITIQSTNRPERMQAWTISAIMSIAQRRLNPEVVAARPITVREKELQKKVLTGMPRIKVLTKKSQIDAIYPYHNYRIQKRNPLKSDYFLDKLHDEVRHGTADNS